MAWLIYVGKWEYGAPGGRGEVSVILLYVGRFGGRGKRDKAKATCAGMGGRRDVVSFKSSLRCDPGREREGSSRSRMLEGRRYE